MRLRNCCRRCCSRCLLSSFRLGVRCSDFADRDLTTRSGHGLFRLLPVWCRCLLAVVCVSSILLFLICLVSFAFALRLGLFNASVVDAPVVDASVVIIRLQLLLLQFRFQSAAIRLQSAAIRLQLLQSLVGETPRRGKEESTSLPFKTPWLYVVRRRSGCTSFVIDRFSSPSLVVCTRSSLARDGCRAPRTLR